MMVGIFMDGAGPTPPYKATAGRRFPWHCTAREGGMEIWRGPVCDGWWGVYVTSKRSGRIWHRKVWPIEGTPFPGPRDKLQTLGEVEAEAMEVAGERGALRELRVRGRRMR